MTTTSAADHRVAADAAAGEQGWTVRDAADLYRVGGWSEDFFFVDDQGRVAVRPTPQDAPIVIDDVVADLRRRDVPFPVLLRFQDVLRQRVVRLNEAFAKAVDEAGYGGSYRAVYPIKVNQLHEVVEEVLEAGRPWGMGLECGSKAELVAALPHLEDDESLLICNGVKDRTMLDLIVSSQRLGKNAVPVVEKYDEFEKLLALGREQGMMPRFGVRVRLATEGAGRWADSAGDLSKFGISIPELIDLVERLQREGTPERLTLLHFHLGSQLADIHIVRQGVRELAHIYAQLVRRGLGIRFLDVGGGLGVNYEAGSSEHEPPMNYTLQEYANAVVYAVKEVCDAEDVPHPTLVSESGRAITAHHSVLVVRVLGAYRKDRIDPAFRPGKEHHSVIHSLHELLEDMPPQPPGGTADAVGTLLEVYHDAVESRDEAETLFTLGYLSLEEKAIAERLYWSVCQCIQERLEALPAKDGLPGELLELEDELAEHYLCDFSVFQSILDHWAIGQGFPIMPIARLDERPRRRALLVDLTCDSDGKVSHYVSSAADRRYLPVHDLEDGQPYFLGFFLMGAYQDIMGDAHNLFGRVAEAHVYADRAEPGDYFIEKIIPATTVESMLETVQYFTNDLERRMNAIVWRKVNEGVIKPKAGVSMLDQYVRCFRDTTYYRPDD